PETEFRFNHRVVDLYRFFLKNSSSKTFVIPPLSQCLVSKQYRDTALKPALETIPRRVLDTYTANLRIQLQYAILALS
ncbi:MAG: hypothetical protein LBJ12_09910, partial [Oscillospiraceae bacterium]|nr:hypothetical protein [Oscillospiraceae bacterium]